MSELGVTILAGFIRIVIGSIFIAGNWRSIDKILITTLIVSFVYSTLICIGLLAFMQPIILMVGALIKNDEYTNFVVMTYLVFYFLMMFGVELKNNRMCLRGEFEDKLIIRSTLISQALSLLAIIFYIIA